MNISYGRTVYISGIGAEMLDLIGRTMDLQQSGDGMVTVDGEELICHVDDAEDGDPLKAFLTPILNDIEGEYGDVVLGR